jgi:hypothetical protein
MPIGMYYLPYQWHLWSDSKSCLQEGIEPETGGIRSEEISLSLQSWSGNHDGCSHYEYACIGWCNYMNSPKQ